ncbi:hypothetical protein ACFWNN_19900 [Lentzea sp. NPDC058450]|uniref:hypothetical protein n=1 Tax=Lentzea sp. NPDC058450 TaxID=3346505 RepID=UPI00365AA83D
MDGFSVDLGELDAVAGKFRGVAADVRDDNAWKFSVDTSRWPEDDPLRAAVEVYDRSLKAARDRLCARTDQMADRVRETAEAYRGAEDEIAAGLRSLRTDGRA